MGEVKRTIIHLPERSPMVLFAGAAIVTDLIWFFFWAKDEL